MNRIPFSFQKPTVRRGITYPHRVNVRVRTGLGYPIDFTIDHGQYGVRLSRGRLSPLQRFIQSGDAIAVVPGRYDLLHSFNAIPIAGRKPFLVTFEDFLPRVPTDRPNPPMERFLRERLLDKRCVSLVAISDYAKRQFIAQHKDWSELQIALNKLQVVRPAVDRRASRPRALDRHVVRLLAVGKDYMRKGFPAVVRAHKLLIADGVNVETTIISKCHWSSQDYIGPPSEDLYREEMRLLKDGGVKHLAGLPNRAVLDEMNRADVLLLPTLHDTFGFVVLEAMSGGTPVIATETCAIPEVIRDGLNGYLLPMQNDPDIGKWEMLYRNRRADYLDKYIDFIENAAEQIRDRVAAISTSPDLYHTMSEQALATVTSRFSPAVARDRYEAIYNSALA